MASIAGVGGDSADVGEKLLNDNVNSQDKMDTTQVPAMVGATGDEKPKKKTIPLPQTALEQRFFTHFMNPMLAKMEDNVRKNTEVLDDLNKKMEEERDERRKKMLSKHIPEILQGSGQDLSSIMKHLQDLIVYESLANSDDPASSDIKAKLRDLDATEDVAILSHSISAYVSTFEPEHLKHFSKQIVSDTSLWLASLFRFADGDAYFHEDEHEGLVRICRLVLRLRYPRYDSDGYEALYTRPPVIYMARSARPGLARYLCTQLGLPLACVSEVPCQTDLGSTEQMDVDALTGLTADDIAAGRTPLLVIAYAGTPLLGHVDRLDVLAPLCKEKDMWLHVEGNSLATLAMYTVPTKILPAKTGDSLTLNIGSWTGIPAVPCVTLYRCRSGGGGGGDATDAATNTVDAVDAVGLRRAGATYRLLCTPLWICLQSLGHDGFVDRIASSLQLAKMVHEKIGEIDSIKKVSKPPPLGQTDDKRPSLGSLLKRAINALVLFELENPVVVFRYVSREATHPVNAGDEDEEAKDERAAARWRYLDALNVWLAETLKRLVPKLHVNSVNVDGEGICLRFAPMESSHAYGTKKEDAELFLTTIDHQLTILDATIKQRDDFQEIVRAQDNLSLIDLPNWAGLGAIQYIPEAYLDEERTWTEEARKEVNAVNVNLVYHLKSADTAFSLGHTKDGLACARFGLITDETDLEELICLVYTTGKEVEESSKFLDTMGDIVRQNIEKASQDLLEEGQQRIKEEGILRQVPLVSSLLNWWSPISSDVMKGRSLNLASGVLESTESTYKCHMQIQEGSTPPLGSPAPGSNTPRKASLKPRRSRVTSSSSSIKEETNASKVAAEVAGSAEVTVGAAAGEEGGGETNGGTSGGELGEIAPLKTDLVD